jgi:molecular chaperone HscB
MDKIVDLSASQHCGFHCWMCHHPLNIIAMFCNSCGCIQPPRDIDYFARLSLEKKIDVDFEQLERNAAALRRTFSAERFIIRGMAEKNFAAKHREAIEIAYETLHDPIRRSRYWIHLNAAVEGNATTQLPPIVAELQSAFEQSEGTSQLDKVAQRTGQEIEFGIIKLLSLLRQRDWVQANQVLVELDGLETLIVQVREKRQAMTPSPNNK